MKRRSSPRSSDEGEEKRPRKVLYTVHAPLVRFFELTREKRFCFEDQVWLVFNITGYKTICALRRVCKALDSYITSSKKNYPRNYSSLIAAEMHKRLQPVFIQLIDVHRWKNTCLELISSQHALPLVSYFLSKDLTKMPPDTLLAFFYDDLFCALWKSKKEDKDVLEFSLNAWMRNHTAFDQEVFGRFCFCQDTPAFSVYLRSFQDSLSYDLIARIWFLRKNPYGRNLFPGEGEHEFNYKLTLIKEASLEKYTLPEEIMIAFTKPKCKNLLESETAYFTDEVNF